MIYALLTSLCWAFSGLGSSRIARYFGPLRANTLRLVISTLVVTVICLGLGTGLTTPSAGWFALSGVIHLFLGDLAMFGAYRRLGPRISVLIAASLSPPAALLAEWWWLGSLPNGNQLLLSAGILLAVILAVAPRERAHLDPFQLRLGVFYGLVASLGQGIGAVVNRAGYTFLNGVEISPWLSTLYRLAGAALGLSIWYGISKWTGKLPPSGAGDLFPHRRVEGHPWLWMALSVSLGTVIGMMFLMRSLEETHASLSQAALATLPVFMIPVAWIFDGNRPSRRSLIAGTVAVGLTILLTQT